VNRGLSRVGDPSSVRALAGRQRRVSGGEVTSQDAVLFDFIPAGSSGVWGAWTEYWPAGKYDSDVLIPGVTVFRGDLFYVALGIGAPGQEVTLSEGWISGIEATVCAPVIVPAGQRLALRAAFPSSATGAGVKTFPVRLARGQLWPFAMPQSRAINLAVQADQGTTANSGTAPAWGPWGAGITMTVPGSLLIKPAPGTPPFDVSVGVGATGSEIEVMQIASGDAVIPKAQTLAMMLAHGTVLNNFTPYLPVGSQVNGRTRKAGAPVLFGVGYTAPLWMTRPASLSPSPPGLMRCPLGQ
jgi:hypothetical protein